MTSYYHRNRNRIIRRRVKVGSFVLLIAALAAAALLAACSDNLGPGDFREAVDCMANPSQLCPGDEEEI